MFQQRECKNISLMKLVDSYNIYFFNALAGDETVDEGVRDDVEEANGNVEEYYQKFVNFYT